MIRLYKKIQKYVKLCTFCDKITHKSRKKQRLLKKNTKNIYVKTVDICAKKLYSKTTRNKRNGFCEDCILRRASAKNKCGRVTVKLLSGYVECIKNMEG